MVQCRLKHKARPSIIAAKERKRLCDAGERPRINWEFLNSIIWKEISVQKTLLQMGINFIWIKRLNNFNLF
jgi:hypothetical protein